MEKDQKSNHRLFSKWLRLYTEGEHSIRYANAVSDRKGWRLWIWSRRNSIPIAIRPEKQSQNDHRIFCKWLQIGTERNAQSGTLTLYLASKDEGFEFETRAIPEKWGLQFYPKSTSKPPKMLKTNYLIWFQFRLERNNNNNMTSTKSR